MRHLATRPAQKTRILGTDSTLDCMTFDSEVLQLPDRELLSWPDVPGPLDFRSVRVAPIRTGGHPAGGWVVPALCLIVPGFRSFWAACRTLAGRETIHMIRKGQASVSSPDGG